MCRVVLQLLVFVSLTEFLQNNHHNGFSAVYKIKYIIKILLVNQADIAGSIVMSLQSICFGEGHFVEEKISNLLYAHLQKC